MPYEYVIFIPFLFFALVSIVLAILDELAELRLHRELTEKRKSLYEQNDAR